MIDGTVLLSAAERLLADSAANKTAPASGNQKPTEVGAQRIRVTLGFVLAGFVTIWLLCVGLIWHMRVNRAGALKGDATAAKKVILPAFEPVLVVLSVVNGFYIVFLVVTLATGYFDVYIPPVILESFYAGNQFMFVLVLVLMCQKSLSFPAVKRSVAISLVLSYYSLLYVWVMTKDGKSNQQKDYQVGLQFVRGLLMLPFVYAFVKPPSRATKRIIRELCFVAIVFYLLTVLLLIVVVDPKRVGASKYVVYALQTWVAFCPLVVWRVLKADTEYWRGIGQRACALQDLFQRQNGLSERVSSQGLHVLIEMNRKCVIDFAYLELVRQLGVGSTSTVYQGTLKTKTPVAVKVYSPSSCCEDVVAAFSHEAAMCSVLNHPNIVKFHGMCVAPPTICLVFQLCVGSLADKLSDQARRLNSNPARQQMLISVGYMLDAARAVAYLHSFSPPFVHRDIRPSNFLVDAECNVQLSDFGESRCVTKLEGGTLPSRANIAVLEDKRHAATTEIGSLSGRTLSHGDSPWTSISRIPASDYAAPEILDANGDLMFYGEAADVYSLAVTMWDIFHPTDEKFPQANGQRTQVQEMVMNGARLKVESNIPSILRGIFERSLQRDLDLRPSAQEIVTALEDVQEELSARLALEFMSGLCELPSAVSGSSGHHRIHSYPGAFIIDRMIDRRFVRCPAEAIRMGNALMDANILHHVNHSRGFGNSATARYYFDLDEVQLSLPGVERSLARRSSVSQNESSIPMLVRGSNGGQPRTSFSFVRTRNNAPCRCRELGQRLFSGKSSRFSRRRGHFKAAPEPTAESNVLTTALLIEDDSRVDITPGTAASMA